VNDDARNLLEIGALASSLPALIGIDIIPINGLGAEKYARLGRLYRLAGTPALSVGRAAEIVGMLSAFGLRVNIGG
jgi:hypothetical protein